jgi:hypothetical protein
MRRAPSVLLPLLCLAVGAACESAFSISSDGIIHVLVTTSGSGSDSDGFTLTVDGGDARFVSSGGSVALEGLAQGTHTLLLSGIAANCAVQGDNPRSVLVGPDGAASVSFVVTCRQAAVEGFQVIVSTTGDAPDPDGYRLAVAGVPIRTIAINAVETFEGLEPGVHLITLKDMADGCTVVGGNPQPFEAVRGRLVQARLDVVCGGAGGADAHLFDPRSYAVW